MLYIIMKMNLSKKGAEALKKSEGFRENPYLCTAGVPTIAYGNTFYLDGRKVTLSDAPIKRAEADDLFLLVVKRFVNAVNKGLKVSVNQNQFDALVSFAYNVGVGAFLRSTLLKKVNQNPNDEAIAAQFLRWNKSGGKVDKGLINRRKHEINLYYA